MESPFCPRYGKRLGKSDEHAVRKNTDRMGSGCGGERLGQEMGKCANTAARHQRLRWDRPLSWLRSDSMMQRKRCRRPIQRIDWSDEVSPSTVSNLHLTQGCLGQREARLKFPR